jgi:hypothetical protein
MNWTLFDFAFAGAMLAILSLAAWFLFKGPQSFSYRLGVGIAVAAAIFVVVTTGAVGIVGSEDNDANLLYLGVLAFALIGAAITRFHPRPMTWVLSATALATASIALVAVMLGWGADGPIWPFDVLGASGLLAVMFAVSAVLFRRAAAR